MSIVDNVLVHSMTNEQDVPSLVVPSPSSQRHLSAFVVLEHSNLTLRIQYVDGILVWNEPKDTSLYHGFHTCPSVEKLISVVPARPNEQLAPRRWYVSPGDQLVACFTNPRSGKEHADFLGFAARVHVV